MRVIVFAPHFPTPEGLVITAEAIYQSSDVLRINYILDSLEQVCLTETGDTTLYNVTLTNVELLQTLEHPEAF